jgi:endogenous inhibitor of DNA gyrase (YacG/DUF329 family)
MPSRFNVCPTCQRDFIGTTKFCSIRCRPIGIRTKLPEHYVWAGMIQRCHNPKATKYAWYGGRGIQVCARWRESFEAFLADMGPRPSNKHSLDRKDGNADYSPDNCRWASTAEQAANRRPKGEGTIHRDEAPPHHTASLSTSYGKTRRF